MRIAIIGCGHVGLVTGICLASLRHEVICLEHEAPLISALEQGKLPIYESYLDVLFYESRSSGLLTFTRDTAQAARNADAIFLCVDVPQLENGESDFSALDTAARQLASSVDSSKLVIMGSTVPVQTAEQLKRFLSIYRGKADISFSVTSNPQFFRKGTSVDDFFHPSRILLGVEDTHSEEILREIYRPITDGSFSCPIHMEKCPASAAPQILVTKVLSAELIKQISNAYLAVKVSYANVLADLCERLGGDVQEVTRAAGLDPRIGSQFLSAGLGFGGSRLPKDVRAFCHLAERLEIEAGIVNAAERVNRERIDVFFEKVQRSMWVIKGKRIAMLGLAHKTGTDDILASPALDLYKRFIAAGASVRVYDPRAMDQARSLYPEMICATDPHDAGHQADALVISTDWNEFCGIDWTRMRNIMARPVLFDGRNLLSPSAMNALGFEYHSVGRRIESPSFEDAE